MNYLFSDNFYTDNTELLLLKLRLVWKELTHSHTMTPFDARKKEAF